MSKLLQWGEIADDFSDALLLGNGASMAIDGCFSYRSLLTNARECGLITDRAERVFDKLRTNDFELVMSKVAQTQEVNQALGVRETVTEGAYRDIRNALVKSVQRHHASYERVYPHLSSIHSFMRRFSTVASLNYDLIAYWALLEGNRVYNRWFKDCFPFGQFDHDWQRFRKPLGAAGATLVFYPHGNLALGTVGGGERKIIKGASGSPFLEAVVERWNNGHEVPLFVSEGQSSQKERAIRRSPYLSTVFDTVLPQLGPTLVVYGWSMHSNDQHILRQICRGSLRKIAVSMHCGDRNRLQIASECELIRQRVRSTARALGREVELCFFDAASAGCWIHHDREEGVNQDMAA